MQKRIIALGFFDGVHLGHGVLLENTAELARKLSLSSAALTFNRHPSHILSNNKLKLINTTAERVSLINSLYHLNEVLICDFDSAFARLSCEEFVREILIKKFNAAHIVSGYDYRFGQGATGDVTKLKLLCEQFGLGYNIIEKVELNGITVSSTHIRKLISEGDMESAASFLGHPHIMEGEVQSGNMLGRTLGLPTINLMFEDGIQIPKLGVYISRVSINGNVFSGVTNIGTRPTVANTARINAETHIIGFNEDLYGKRVQIEFLHYLREEKRFSSIDVLKEQIKKDIESTMSFKAQTI